MVTDLVLARDNLAALIFSPDLKRLRRISLGTVEWPGLPIRRYLSGGSTLSTTERARAEELLAALDLQSMAADERQEQFTIIAKMLLTYPVANASAETGKARGEAYLEALSDIPATVIAEAIKRWNRGEAGQEHDYRWAPAPAVLRQVCQRVLMPVREAADDLRNLLSAVSLERAMDPTPIDQPVSVPALRAMS